MQQNEENFDMPANLGQGRFGQTIRLSFRDVSATRREPISEGKRNGGEKLSQGLLTGNNLSKVI